MNFLVDRKYCFRYDKRIKPPVSESLRVNISVVLLSLSSPDESSLVRNYCKILQDKSSTKAGHCFSITRSSSL